MSKSIKLTNSNQMATVDDEDFVWLNKFEWSDYNGYAVTTIAGKMVEMGTLIYLMHNHVIPMTKRLFDDVKRKGN